MASFSGLGIGLSLLLGCLLLSLALKLYYLLWRRKRITSKEIADKDYNSNYGKEIFHLFCFKKPSSLQEKPDLELGTKEDLIKNPFGEEDSVESEIMRLQNLSGPPRFLFTIKEETMEDLESEDGKSRGDRSRKGSRSDFILSVDNPLTPLASPKLKSSPLNSLDYYNHHGFNPLLESSVDAEIKRLRSSPPPKFKFLRKAEEKLVKRSMEEAEKRAYTGSVQDSRMAVTEETEGSFLCFISSRNNPSSFSQVLPLASSPATFRALEKPR